MTVTAHAPGEWRRRIRAVVKDALSRAGLLPLFRRARCLLQGVTGFLWLFPLRILVNTGLAYTRVVWRLNPNTKLLKDYLPKIVGKQRTTVYHWVGPKRVAFEFYTPNATCQYRADSFSTKEPETLDWIDRFGGGGVLFDVGANVGVYSIYHAKTQNASVFAFEPSVLNLPVLVKNINANDLQSKIKVIANPLSARCGFANFKLTTADEGGSLSAFGVDYGQDGKSITSLMWYETYGFTLDYLLESGVIAEKPRLIKLDVDGIEHLILDGARRTLSDPECQSVLVEIDENFRTQATLVAEILGACGFSFKYKKRGAMSTRDPGGTFNHVWAKNG